MKIEATKYEAVSSPSCAALSPNSSASRGPSSELIERKTYEIR